MKHQVVVKKSAQKNLEKIDRRFQTRIFIVLSLLSQNPYLGKPLIGKLEGKRSYRVWPYRIVYQVLPKEKLVAIIDIAHRQGVYN